MAPLPRMEKATLLLFRRRGPDEILVTKKPPRGEASLPYALCEPGEAPVDAARRVAPELAHGPVANVLKLALSNEFKVKNGPSAGDWRESFVAVEMAADARAARGAEWRVHYDAKAALAHVKARDAITELRAVARLLP